MSVLVTVDVLCKPGSGGADSVTKMMRERLPFTRSYDGCEEIYLYADQDDPNHLVLVEQWASREHYTKYREWAMSQPDTLDMVSIMAREMITTYLDKTDA